MLMQQLMAQPIPQLHDIEIETVRDDSKCCIAVVPPEEFGISALHPCVSIQETPFCYQRSRKTVSALKELGCPDEILAKIGSNDSSVNLNPISLARDRYTDELRTGLDSADDTMRDVWVTDSFIRVDFDEDGIAELRRVVLVENEVWIISTSPRSRRLSCRTGGWARALPKSSSTFSLRVRCCGGRC
jgi:hypothetical protein